MKKITIMTPCYNEQDGIIECYQTVKSFFSKNLRNYSYEHLFIDNASEDSTVEILKDIASKDKNIKIIVNTRNFGSNHSPYHAILQSAGDCVIPIVADLQTPVNTIQDFVKLWENGYDMVLGLRIKMYESIWLRFLRNSYYKLMLIVSDLEHYDGFIGFGLYDKKTVNAMRKFKEPNPYFRTIISEVGFKKAFVEYNQPPRKHGKSKLSFSELFDYASLGVVSSSKKPLRIMSSIGLISSVLSFIVGLIYLSLKLMFWNSFSLGLAPIIIGLLFFGSIQLFCFGIIGEYIGVILDYVRNRPLVIEKERINFD